MAHADGKLAIFPVKEMPTGNHDDFKKIESAIDNYLSNWGGLTDETDEQISEIMDDLGVSEAQARGTIRNGKAASGDVKDGIPVEDIPTIDVILPEKFEK